MNVGRLLWTPQLMQLCLHSCSLALDMIAQLRRPERPESIGLACDG